MEVNKIIEGSSEYLDCTIERLEDEPFLGSEGRKIKMTVDIFVITKLKSDKDNEILSKIFYLTQQKRGLELENNTVDFKQEQKQKEPPPPIPAPIEELNQQEYQTIESILKKFKVAELKEIINRSKKNIPFKTLTKDKLINKIITNQIEFYDLLKKQPKKKADVKTKSKVVYNKKIIKPTVEPKLIKLIEEPKKESEEERQIRLEKMREESRKQTEINEIKNMDMSKVKNPFMARFLN